MSDRALRIGVVALALAGAAVSAYLISVRAAGAELVCATGGCKTVQSSAYAEVLGVPVAGLGLAAFLLIGVTGLSGAWLFRAVGASLALAALTFSGYLLVVQLAAIGAVCDWCLVSDALTTALAVVALLRLRELTSPRAAPAPARSGRARRGSRGAASA